MSLLDMSNHRTLSSTLRNQTLLLGHVGGWCNNYTTYEGVKQKTFDIHRLSSDRREKTNNIHSVESSIHQTSFFQVRRDNFRTARNHLEVSIRISIPYSRKPDRESTTSNSKSMQRWMAEEAGDQPWHGLGQIAIAAIWRAEAERRTCRRSSMAVENLSFGSSPRALGGRERRMPHY
jgi:hypothetical protein